MSVSSYMYPTEMDAEIISYSSFYDIPEELVLKEDLNLIDDLTTYIVNEYIEILVKSPSRRDRLDALNKLREWLDFNIHLGQIFVLNRLAINEENIEIKKGIISLLKFIKENR